MKKFLIAALALCTIGAGQAKAFNDEVEEGFSEKAYVGMSIANLRNTGALATDPKVGFSMGFLGEYVLPGAAGTYVNAGVDLSMQGCKASVLDKTQKLRTYYITIPIHVGYRYEIAEKWAAYADFGPYFAFGLGGKWNEGGQKFFKKESKGGYGANRFDCGLGFRVGGEFNKKLSLTAGFNWGLSPTIDHESPIKDVKTFCSTITLGYRF